MSYIRIRCKLEERAHPHQSGPILVSGLLASMFDTEVFLVDDAGFEHRIPGLKKVEWSVSDSEVSLARITLLGAEIEADANVIDFIREHETKP